MWILVWNRLFLRTIEWKKDCMSILPYSSQESRGAEEVTELQRQLGGDSKEGVIIETFLVIVGRRNVLLEELMELL
jgi:hypothetical protein